MTTKLYTDLVSHNATVYTYTLDNTGNVKGFTKSLKIDQSEDIPETGITVPTNNQQIFPESVISGFAKTMMALVKCSGQFD